jgi:hypothetical protein
MNELNVKVENANGILVTTSNRVANELGVKHKDLLEKIDKYVAKFSSAETSAQFYIPDKYKTLDGRVVRNYLITEKGIAQLIGGYSSAVPKAFDLNVAYINEFERMRKALTEFKAPKTLKEALTLALAQEEKIEALTIENKELSKKIEEYIKKNRLTSMEDFAEELGTSDTMLYSFLNVIGVIYFVAGDWNFHTPYRHRGFAELRTTDYRDKTGKLRCGLRIYWTEEGKDFVKRLINQYKM